MLVIVMTRKSIPTDRRYLPKNHFRLRIFYVTIISGYSTDILRRRQTLRSFILSRGLQLVVFLARILNSFMGLSLNDGTTYSVLSDLIG